jgi:hypothetical protein
MATNPYAAENTAAYVKNPFSSTLALLVAGIRRADDPHDALAPHDLAVLADLPD